LILVQEVPFEGLPACHPGALFPMRHEGICQSTDLKPNSVSFWLIVLIAVGIVYIGARFLVAPLQAAEGFGVPAEGSQTLAYEWAKGTRDIVSGLLLIALLWLRVGRQVVAAFVGVAALIPVGDFINVSLNVGSNNPMALAIHGGTALFMVILAAFSWTGSR
jgi:hypothetical protein